MDPAAAMAVAMVLVRLVVMASVATPAREAAARRMVVTMAVVVSVPAPAGAAAAVLILMAEGARVPVPAGAALALRMRLAAAAIVQAPDSEAEAVTTAPRGLLKGVRLKAVRLNI